MPTACANIYKQAGADQKHVFGEGVPGSKPPDFTKIPGIRANTPASAVPLGAPQPAVPPKPAAVVPPSLPETSDADSGAAAPAKPPADRPPAPRNP
jgi:hypothetical protein